MITDVPSSVFCRIVAVGGDGTANKVADALLKRAQKEYDVELKPGLSPVKAPLPLGIIPQGKTDTRNPHTLL